MLANSPMRPTDCSLTTFGKDNEETNDYSILKTKTMIIPLAKFLKRNLEDDCIVA